MSGKEAVTDGVPSDTVTPGGRPAGGPGPGPAAARPRPRAKSESSAPRGGRLFTREWVGLGLA